MSTGRRRDVATATLGYGGLVGSGALRHSALEAAYDKGPRPRWVQERKLLKASRGRGRYLAGAALAIPAGTAAAYGTNRLLSKAEHRRHSFVAEGLSGTREALTARGQTMAARPPARLVAGNYALGAAIGSGAAGATHLGLRKTRLHGGLKAGLATAAGVAAGSATLPIQSKIIRRASRGKYEATSTGVQRVAKAEDIGAKMSRSSRRAAVTAAGVPIPVVGDIAQAATAARLSPKRYRGRTAVEEYAGGTLGGLTGNAVGAGAALGAARLSPRFNRKATNASDKIDEATRRARAKVHLPEKTGPGLAARAIEHEKAPRTLVRAARYVTRSPIGRAVARNPKVAAVGALAGGAIGGQIGQQTTYSHIMSRDDAYRRAHNPSARHGSRIAKLETPKPLTRREKKVLATRKEKSAVLSATGGTFGLTALGTTLASAHRSPLRAAHKARIGRLTVPLLTGGAGVGGANALLGARIQHKEAQQTVAKFALKPTGMPRVPSMRRGFIRQTRYPSGITRVSSVRGGLS